MKQPRVKPLDRVANSSSDEDVLDLVLDGDDVLSRSQFKGRLLHKSTLKPDASTAVANLVKPNDIPLNSHSNERRTVRIVKKPQRTGSLRTTETQTSVNQQSVQQQAGPSYLTVQNRSVETQAGESFIEVTREWFLSRRIEPATPLHLDRHTFNFGTHRLSVTHSHHQID